VVADYASLWARSCVPIYNALDPSTHFPVAADARFAADLGFLGNRLPDREARVEEFFLRAAASLPEKAFLLGGSGWGDKGLPFNVRYAGHVYTADHNAFNCTPRAVLNISRESMARYGYSPATRVFEAAGAGACLITDAWVGIEEFFDPGVELLVAKSGDEVAEHMRTLTPERAQSIGRAAFARALAEHTYAQRAVELEQALGVTARGASRIFSNAQPAVSVA
jgi:spore maturation protein CgeB